MLPAGGCWLARGPLSSRDGESCLLPVLLKQLAALSSAGPPLPNPSKEKKHRGGVGGCDLVHTAKQVVVVVHTRLRGRISGMRLTSHLLVSATHT